MPWALTWTWAVAVTALVHGPGLTSSKAFPTRATPTSTTRRRRSLVFFSPTHPQPAAAPPSTAAEAAPPALYSSGANYKLQIHPVTWTWTGFASRLDSIY